MRPKTPGDPADPLDRRGHDDDGNTRWFLVAYSNRDDELASEHLLVGVTTEEVRAITGMPSHDPMYDVYPLPDSHVEWAERAAGVELDLERNAYFLGGRFERPSGKP